jgi:outer membrane lipoprotein-sorting protein
MKLISNRHYFLAVVLLLIGIFALMPQAAQAGTIPFTADNVSMGPDGKVMAKGKMFSDGKNVRMEMNQPGMPGKMVVIYQKDSNKAIMMMGNAKKYFEMDADDSMMASLAAANKAKKKKLGTETLNGFKCTKYSIVNNIEVMGMKQTVEATIWESKKLGYPIRTKTKDGAVQELRNIKRTTPPTKLFKVPAGYQKVQNMMQLMMPKQ